MTKSNILFNALVLGLFIFSFIAIFASGQAFEEYMPFLPVVIAAFAATRMHHLSSKEFLHGSLVGAITGVILGLIVSVLILLLSSFYALATEDVITQPGFSSSIPLLLIVTPLVVTTVSGVVGAFTGFMTVTLNRLF